MSEVKFQLKPVEKKPSRRFKKGSKYDPVIDEFLEGNESLVEVNVKGKIANYLRNQLSKRIEARGIGGKVEASVINDCCYLEK
jgi:hypothetical protein